jgi:ribonuclease P protein component
LIKKSYSKSDRLVSKEDFQSVFAHSKKISDKRFVVLYCANDLKRPRLGIIIPKQRIKSAATRNALRRQIRESFRLIQESLKGLDIIVLLRSECTPFDKKALRTDIDHLWPRISA